MDSSKSPHTRPSKLTPAAVSLFCAILIAFVFQSALTQYVQSTRNYRQPFLLFYIAHSSFSIILPLHIAFLAATSATPISQHLHALRHTLILKFSPDGTTFPTRQYALLVVALTAGATGPGLLWYCSVSLTSISDITALWNANALWAYALAVPILGTPWSARAASAVVLAFLGTLAVVYGSSAPSSAPERARPLLGASLSFLASVGYALYQVLYKRFVALDHSSAPVPGGPGDAAAYAAISAEEEERSSEDEDGEELLVPRDAAHELPFGMYPNALTSSIGLCTFLLLGLIVIYLQPPPPPDMLTTVAIAGIALNGVVFNSGYLVLLGLWGPVLTSVGSLLTIVLMLVYDMLVGGVGSLTFWSFAGSGAIIAGFVVLALDVMNHHDIVDESSAVSASI